MSKPSKPSKPSLVSFMAQPPEPAKVVKPVQSDDIVALSFRMPRATWEQVCMLTMTERTKIQPYLLGLIKADLERRGLRTK